MQTGSACRKNNKIPNEQPAFGCQQAFGSHSHSLTNKLFSSFFFTSLTWAFRMHDENGTFSWFSNVFHHFRVRWSKYTTVIPNPQNQPLPMPLSCVKQNFPSPSTFNPHPTPPTTHIHGPPPLPNQDPSACATQLAGYTSWSHKPPFWPKINFANWHSHSPQIWCFCLNVPLQNNQTL